MIRYKTRGGSSEQGKPRVFFAGDRLAFQQCFEALSADVLQIHNCAVFYEDQWDVTETERLSDSLSNMQLLIVPITENMLTCKPQGTFFAYRYAMQHHIPVLPIMMEPGLNILFSKVMNHMESGYGDIQYLDRTSTDTSEIAYAEKLKKRIRSILISDADVLRIKAAFNASIFLSYRKKDRFYANELMRLIHEIPYCRDVAIWYDEYLVAGESWSEAIAEALDQSSLVVLAVTPSLLESGNYVVMHEYPEARKKGKSIVPAMIKETDKEAVKQLYPGISEIVDGKNSQEMSCALQTLNPGEINIDPEHRFLIGLAYLGAVDVKRDVKIAEEDITFAASRGWMEAMKKLVDMYRNGEGVACNYGQAVYWQKEVVAQYRLKYEIQNDEKSGDDYCEALNYLADTQMLQGRYQDSLGTLQAVQNVLDHFNVQNRKWSVQYEDVISCQVNFARALKRIGKWQEARNILITAGHTLAGFYQVNRRQSTLLNLCAIYETLGDIEKAFNHLDVAKQYFVSMLEIHLSTQEIAQPADSAKQLSLDYIKVGDCARLMQDFAEAHGCYEKALELRSQRFEEVRNADAMRDVMLAYYRFAENEKAQQHRKNADHYYRQAIQCGEQIMTYSDVKSLVMRFFYEAGVNALYDSEIESGSRYIKQAVSIAQDLENIVQDMTVLHIMGNLYMQQARMAGLAHNLEEEGSYCQKAVKVHQRVLKQEKLLRNQMCYMLACKQYADWLLQSDQLVDAFEMYQHALEQSQIIAQGNQSIANKKEVCSLLRKCGDILVRLGHPDMAKKYLVEQLKISENIAQEACTGDHVYAVGCNYYNLWLVDPAHEYQSLKMAYMILQDMANTNPDDDECAKLVSRIRNELSRYR